MPEEPVAFTFSWLALKLLGRGLYSNPWSALSELVANGLDAGATHVHVSIDARNRASAMVEVIDDGRGMTRQEIATYVKVGYNKRSAANTTEQAPMGRKGIGKLAALYLSRNFYLLTRSAVDETQWQLDARDAAVTDDEHPSLRPIGTPPPTANDQLWEQRTSGTRLILTDVDLSGYGDKAMTGLSARLANQFLLDHVGGPKVMISVWTDRSAPPPEFKLAQKRIAFNNLAYVAMDFRPGDSRPEEIQGPTSPVKVPAVGLDGDTYQHDPEQFSFPTPSAEREDWGALSRDVDFEARTYKGLPFRVSGWIGAHATIDSAAARLNDTRFDKNRFYNPAQIRVYVRGKLASDHLLSQLGLTGTYTNYIEGEISFDLLDEDSLPDIATSNRQDFDETDERVTLLRHLVRPIVRSLIQKRTALAQRIGEEVRQQRDARATAAKRAFSRQLRNDLDQRQEIPDGVRDELHLVITNKIKGEVQAKTQYRVFISHARADAAFATYIDEVLQSRGALPHEIFFTSRSGNITAALDERALGALIRESIVDSNTLIFYLTSANFLSSQFCLFEGGAGWATRGILDYLKLNVDYDSIPVFLHNGRSEITLRGADGTVSLTPEVHNYLVRGVLNPMISHLNQGREIAGSSTIPLFDDSPAPTQIEMARLGKSPADYFDTDLVEHWNLLVADKIEAYLAAYDS